MHFLDRLRRRKERIRDYLFVDETLLNSYLEQISSTEVGSIVTSLRAGVSPSPSISGELGHRFRAKNTHEKVRELVRHLERQQSLAHERPALIRRSGEDVEKPDFVLEECDAVRVLIPDVGGSGATGTGIVVWVSEWPLKPPPSAMMRPGLLCMIQGRMVHDPRTRIGFEHSGYTWLQTLLYQLHREGSRSVLTERYPHLRLYEGSEEDSNIIAFRPQLSDQIEVIRAFPLRWLRENGCVLSASQRISALYRIRAMGGDEIGTENRFEDFTISTFAYAIAIWTVGVSKSS